MATGCPRSSSTIGYRGGEHIIGPVDYPADYRAGGAVERGEHVGAMALGIENTAVHGVQGRGVMIDLEAHFGRGEKFVGYDELMHIMDADKVEVAEGDPGWPACIGDRAGLRGSDRPRRAAP